MNERVGAIELDDTRLDTLRASAPRLPWNRRAFAATRVVVTDEYANEQHTDGRALEDAIDWAATADLRRELDALGFGIAEAMDTAQRFELGWPLARRLIRLSGELELENGFIAGAGLDELPDDAPRSEQVDAIVAQAHFIQQQGGIVILLPVAALSRKRATAGEYVRFYSDVLAQLDGPVGLHWLGAMFHPGLTGYFPERSFEELTERHADTIRFVKLSLLDAEREVRLRRELATRDQLVLTGDDFHFASLMLGGEARASLTNAPEPTGTTRIGELTFATGDFSHGLLGILDAIADPVALALRLLARGDVATYRQLMEPCEALSRWLFQEPTRHYKAGLAFVSWLVGRQSNPALALQAQRERSHQHFLRAAELANDAGLIRDAALSAQRLRAFMAGAVPGLPAR